MKKFTLIISIALALAFVLGACAGQPAPQATTAPAADKPAEPAKADTAATGKPITIGMAAIQTGTDTYIHGELIILAAQFAADEINAAGGINGRPLKIIVMDDAGDPKQAVTVANAFCANPEVVGVIGHPYSGASIPALPIYKACGMPVVVHGTNPRITELGFDNIVQGTGNDFISGTAAADYVKDDLKLSSVAIIHNKTIFGQGVASVFQARLKQIGVTVTSYTGVDPTDVDFTPVLTTIKGENPDLIYFAGYTEGALIRKQMLQLGITAKYMAAESVNSEYIDVVKDQGIGTISVQATAPLDLNDKLKAFDAAFFAKNGKHPESWSMYYYDHVYHLADAIRRAGEPTRANIVAQMHNIDAPSLLTDVNATYDSRGRLNHPVTFIYEMKDDMQFHLVKKWAETPPYQTMSDAEYVGILNSLK
jgi:branched-chain amino acid transport system substrate-binding protein